MFIYEPGSGFSGPCVKVEPGFEMEQVRESQQFSRQNDIASTAQDTFSMTSMSDVVSSIETEPTLVKRYFIVI